MQIRKAQPNEAEKLTQIALAAKAHWDYPKSWLALWKDDLTFTPEIIAESKVFVMSVDNEIVGFYKLIIDETVADLEHLWIDPKSIGTGIGSKLFRHALEKASSLNAKTMTIKSDPNAEGFYGKMGAEKTGDDVSEIEGKERKLPLMQITL